MKFLEGHFVKDFAAFAVAVVLVAGGFNYVNAAPDEDIRIGVCRRPLQPILRNDKDKRVNIRAIQQTGLDG